MTPEALDPVAFGRDALEELVPLVRRVCALDPAALLRIRSDAGTVTGLVRLPFGVLAARTVAVAAAAADTTYRCGELLDWLDGSGAAPQPRAAEWRGAIPPAGGWRRIETVPDSDVRPLVRSGALTLKEAAAREGVPGAQPRADVADALLDSTVLTVTDAATSVPVTLRALSALTRMGFLPRGSYVAIDVAGRWTRVAAAYGSVFTERTGLSLTLR